VEERIVDQEADLVAVTFEEMVLLIGVVLITMVQEIVVVDMGLLVGMVEDKVGGYAGNSAGPGVTSAWD
jgi:hypothetical protein